MKNKTTLVFAVDILTNESPLDDFSTMYAIGDFGRDIKNQIERLVEYIGNKVDYDYKVSTKINYAENTEGFELFNPKEIEENDKED